jgi:ABC-type transporter Mla subunit MlaD
MKRLAMIALAAVALAAVIVAVKGSTAHGAATARFDVIFDDARGLVSGQLVKVAGANAGTIDNVVLTSDFKARIEASIDARFMPFHQNATCTIRPEGLIAENYLECDPGTPASPVIRASGGNPPTLPVTRTTEPVSLLDLFNTFNLPTTERMAAIVDELGIATAGRGEDINQILERANPALGAARDAISVLTSQQSQLQTLIDSGNKLTATGASDTAGLQRFLNQAAALTSLTAGHSSGLSQSIARLPGLLAATKPALTQLDTIATQGTPLLQQLKAAAPSLNQATNDLGPFAQAAKPALAKMSVALTNAIPAIRQSTPLLRSMRSYTDRSKSNTALAANLFGNLQQHGFTESFLSVVYYTAAALSRFDATSHLLPLYVIAPQNGACGNYATKPVAGCSAHYGAQTSYAPQGSAAHGRRRAAARGRTSATGAQPAQPGTGSSSGSSGASGSGGSSGTGGGGGTPGLPSLPAPPAPSQVIQALTSFLLK